MRKSNQQPKALEHKTSHAISKVCWYMYRYICTIVTLHMLILSPLLECFVAYFYSIIANLFSFLPLSLMLSVHCKFMHINFNLLLITGYPIYIANITFSTLQ